MDRNNVHMVPDVVNYLSLSARRAWIEITAETPKPSTCASLSARRAWIEIAVRAVDTAQRCVALRKESVDRNWSIADTDSLTVLSLSARRAWIEIVWIGAMRWACRSRSPQGERG